MSKFACSCGYVMNLSVGRPNYEFALIPEFRIEEIAEKLDGSPLLTVDDFYGLVDEVKNTVYRCPSCGRIHLDDGGGVFKSYVLEG